MGFKQQKEIPKYVQHKYRNKSTFIKKMSQSLDKSRTSKSTQKGMRLFDIRQDLCQSEEGQFM